MLAHSAKNDVPAQTYQDHVYGVLRRIIFRLSQLRAYLGEDHFRLVSVVLQKAGATHDMGKVDGFNQQVLRGEARLSFGSKMINHTDAPTAYALRSGRTDDKMAGWLANSHHTRLRNFGEDLRDNTDLGVPKYQWLGLTGLVREHTDKMLPEYIRLHESVISLVHENVDYHIDQIPAGLVRLMLSVLVDADWGDTAGNYKNFVPEQGVELRAEERLAVLESHVVNLQTTSPATKRNRLRQQIFEYCKNFPLRSFTECPALVGLGKTYATIAYALVHKPRKVIYCAPFTSLLSQTEKDFKQCLVLPDENAWEVVAAHHHQNEYKEDSLAERALTTTWMPPIILTTHVQFFETCFGNTPSMLRKFFNLMGAHILIDESHLFPEHLWPLAIESLRFLVECLGCRVTFISGSMIKPWKSADIGRLLHQPAPEVQSMIPIDIWNESLHQEKQRVKTTFWKGSLLDLDGICNLMSLPEYKGSKVAIFNTTMNAAVVAYELRQRGERVLHLSTTLAPIDREQIIDQVVAYCQAREEFILVATSCVEAGMNFSFEFGFREMSGLLNIQQLLGRLNRSNEFRIGSLLVFELITKLTDFTSPFTVNHDYDEPKRVCKLLQRKGKTGCEYSDLYFQQLIKTGLRPCTFKEEEISVDKLMDAERLKQMETVHMFSRVISQAKKSVLINESILDGPFSNSDLVRNSVEIYDSKVEQWQESGLIEWCKTADGVMVWRGQYDNFLGYLAGFAS